MPRTMIKSYILQDNVSDFGFKIHRGAVFLKADMTMVSHSPLDPRGPGMAVVPCLWFEVDTEAEVEDRTFTLLGSGTKVDDFDKLTYFGTIQNTVPVGRGQVQHSVYHLYEKTPRTEYCTTCQIPDHDSCGTSRE